MILHWCQCTWQTHFAHLWEMSFSRVASFCHEYGSTVGGLIWYSSIHSEAGADPGFSSRGVGQKRLCACTHILRVKIEGPRGLGPALRALEALVFVCSLMLFEPYFKHSDTKNIVNQFFFGRGRGGGGGGACFTPIGSTTENCLLYDFNKLYHKVDILWAFISLTHWVLDHIKMWSGTITLD